MRNMIAKACAALSLGVMLGSAAAAPVTYDFTFTDTDPGASGRIDATGSFITGDASTSDPGYYLLTSLTYTSLFVDNAVQAGSAVQTSFEDGSAYDPSTGAFVNHYNNGTYVDYGGGGAQGHLGNEFLVVDSSSLDFTQYGNSFSGQAFTKSANFNFAYSTVLSIVAESPADPGTVPEPGSLALIGLGLAGLAVSRRSVRR